MSEKVCGLQENLRCMIWDEINRAIKDNICPVNVVVYSNNYIRCKKCKVGYTEFRSVSNVQIGNLNLTGAKIDSFRIQIDDRRSLSLTITLSLTLPDLNLPIFPSIIA